MTALIGVCAVIRSNTVNIFLLKNMPYQSGAMKYILESGWTEMP